MRTRAILSPRRAPRAAMPIRRLLASAILPFTIACSVRFDYGRTEPRDGATAAATCHGLPDAEGTAGIDATVLDSIRRTAEATMTDELVIVRDGRVVLRWRHPEFRDTIFNPQSVTKAVAALGVGVLLDDRRIASLDLPLRELFPAFQAPDKSAVTLRMLMAHTSGIAAAAGEAQFAGQSDVEAFILARPMAEPAGTTARYNNLGAQLMGQVIQARSGTTVARLLEERILSPLCIRRWTWDHDGRGATYTYSRVRLRAEDLAAIGQLVLDGGMWQGRRLLSQAAVDTLTHINGTRGLSLAPHAYAASWEYAGEDHVLPDSAWLDRLAAAAVSDTLLAAGREALARAGGKPLLTSRFKQLLDSAFATPSREATMQRWYRETDGRAEPMRTRGVAQAVMHSGSWGQYLIVFPETRTVVVRYADWRHDGREDENDAGAWKGIVSDLYWLIGTQRTRRP